MRAHIHYASADRDRRYCNTATSSSPVARAQPSPEQLRQMAEAGVATQFEAIPTAAQGCDVLVAGGALQFAARSVAEQMGRASCRERV